MPRSRLATIVGQQGSPLCSIAIRRIDQKQLDLCASFLSVVPTTCRWDNKRLQLLAAGRLLKQQFTRIMEPRHIHGNKLNERFSASFPDGARETPTQYPIGQRSSQSPYQSLMRPLLAYGQDGGAKNIGEAIKSLADEFQLSEQDRSQLEIVFIGRGLIWIMWALSKKHAVLTLKLRSVGDEPRR